MCLGLVWGGLGCVAYGGMGLMACKLLIHGVSGRLWHSPIALCNRSRRGYEISIGLMWGVRGVPGLAYMF